MYKIITIILFLVAPFYAFSQVGINTQIPSDAASLDVNSTMNTGLGGLKLPTITNTQKSSIAVTPASEGIILFVTYPSGDRCLEIYDGVQDIWQKINCLTVGRLVLWEQDFDINTTWNYASDVSFFNASSVNFYGITNSLGSISLDNNFLGVYDLNSTNIGFGTSGFATVTFDTVAVTGNNLTVEFDYDIDGWDTSDDLYYTVSVDGVTQTEVFFIDGASGLSVSGTEVISIPNGTTTIGFEFKFRQNGPDQAGFDNFRIVRN